MHEASPGRDCDLRESVGKSHVGLCARIDCPESLLRQFHRELFVPHCDGFPVCVVGAQEGDVLTLSIKQHVFNFEDRPLKTHVA